MILYRPLSLAVIFAGVQDWRRGEVSNWITVPLFALGCLACVVRIVFSPATGILIVFIDAALTVFTFLRWMGGADWKVLVGLFGLWPLAGLMALIVAAIWGIIEMMRTKNIHARFPGVSAFAVAVILTVLLFVL